MSNFDFPVPLQGVWPPPSPAVDFSAFTVKPTESAEALDRNTRTQALDLALRKAELCGGSYAPRHLVEDARVFESYITGNAALPAPVPADHVEGKAS